MWTQKLRDARAEALPALIAQAMLVKAPYFWLGPTSENQPVEQDASAMTWPMYERPWHQQGLPVFNGLYTIAMEA